MKAVRNLVLGLLAVLLVAYAIWVQFPSAQHAEVTELALANARQRNLALLELAKDPELNGYLEPTLLPYWGRQSGERDPKAPIEQVLEAWQDYSSSFKGEKVDHSKLQQDQDQAYLKALEDFRQLRPQLLQALQKPVFYPPNSPISFDTEVMNFNGIRNLALLTVGLAEADVAAGDPASAAEATVSILQLGSKMMAHGTLIQDMIGVAIQAIGTDGFLELIPPQTQLEASIWKDLAARLVEAIPPTEQMEYALEGELLFGQSIFDSLDQPFDGLEEINNPIPLPGFTAREERIYKNTMTGMLITYRDTRRIVQDKSLTEPNFFDWVTGRAGYLQQVLVPNTERAATQMEINRARISGLATAVGVLAYRAQEGVLPSDLSKLTEAGIPHLEPMPENLKFSLEDETAILIVTVDDPTAPAIINSWKREIRWYQQQDNELRFILPTN